MHTLWNDSFSLPSFPRLEENLRADVAVVGGGIAGILTAYALHAQGIRVVLLEGGRLAAGVTAHTTAKISAQHGLFCERLVHSFGRYLAQQYLHANLQAVRQYRALVREKRIDCDFSDEASYVYAAPDGPRLERELECAQLLGAPVRLARPEGLPFAVREAVCFDHQAQFSPLPFLAALVPELTVYENSPVRDVRAHAVRCDGGTVRAEQIVVATHFPMLVRHGLYPLRLRQERSYILALADTPPLSGMWLDAGEDGWSLRRCGELLLLGGGAHRCGVNLGDSYDRLRAHAKLLFPRSREVLAWSTQDCMTLDGVPYIGAYSASTPWLHVATGFGKWGMTGSMVAATVLTARLTGASCPYADIFSPSRFFPSASISAFMEGAGYAVRGLGRRLFVPAQTAAEHIAPGHGGTAEWHGKKYGVYRHPNGTLYAVDLKCPHFGCELTWNDDEKTWDCPCHGSRFDYEGHRLSEPAKAALHRCEDFPREV